MKITDPIDVDG